MRGPFLLTDFLLPGACSDTLVGYPTCAIVETSVQTLLEQSEDLSDAKIGEYVLHEIQTFVPAFNSDASRHMNRAQLEYTYPITGKLLLLSSSFARGRRW